MKIIIVDGQGGKIGKLLIEKIKQGLPDIELLAIGSNSIATATMLKAGADYGATGENPVIVNTADADIIIGPIGIISANALLGEITPSMAAAIGNSNADKILIPLNKCKLHIVGQSNNSLSDYINEAVIMLKDLLK